MSAMNGNWESEGMPSYEDCPESNGWEHEGMPSYEDCPEEDA